MPHPSKKSSERNKPGNNKQADNKTKNVDQRAKPQQDDNPHAADTQSEFAHAEALRGREE